MHSWTGPLGSSHRPFRTGASFVTALARRLRRKQGDRGALRLVLALAYGLNLLMPLVRSLGHQTEAGSCVCLATLDGVPAIGPDCEGPCRDPTHHHHHDSHCTAHCLLCKGHSPAPAISTPIRSVPVLLCAGWVASSALPNLFHEPTLSSGSIRSPPLAAT